MSVWRLTVADKHWHETDLSLADAERVETYVGRAGWLALHPSHGGPKALRALIACFLMKGRDITWDQALTEAGEVGVGVANTFIIVDDDLPDLVNGLPDPPAAAPTTG